MMHIHSTECNDVGELVIHGKDGNAIHVEGANHTNYDFHKMRGNQGIMGAVVLILGVLCEEH